MTLDIRPDRRPQPIQGSVGTAAREAATHLCGIDHTAQSGTRYAVVGPFHDPPGSRGHDVARRRSELELKIDAVEHRVVESTASPCDPLFRGHLVANAYVGEILDPVAPVQHSVSEIDLLADKIGSAHV